MAPETTAARLCLTPNPEQRQQEPSLTLALQREGPQLPPSPHSSLAGCLPSVRSSICMAGTYTFQQQPKPRLKSQSKGQAWSPRLGGKMGGCGGEEGAEQAASRCRGPPQDHARSGTSEGGVWCWGRGGNGVPQPNRREERREKLASPGGQKQECWELSAAGLCWDGKEAGGVGEEDIGWEEQSCCHTEWAQHGQVNENE